jgi:hypothetical protein
MGVKMHLLDFGHNMADNSGRGSRARMDRTSQRINVPVRTRRARAAPGWHDRCRQQKRKRRKSLQVQALWRIVHETVAVANAHESL